MLQVEDGIEWAEAALAIEEQSEGPLLARCCLYAGIGHQMKAQVNPLCLTVGLIRHPAHSKRKPVC